MYKYIDLLLLLLLRLLNNSVWFEQPRAALEVELLVGWAVHLYKRGHLPFFLSTYLPTIVEVVTVVILATVVTVVPVERVVTVVIVVTKTLFPPNKNFFSAKKKFHQKTFSPRNNFCLITIFKIPIDNCSSQICWLQPYECVNTQHTYNVMNTKLYSILYTVLYSVL